jgi:hypothetical protein
MCTKDLRHLPHTIHSVPLLTLTPLTPCLWSEPILPSCSPILFRKKKDNKKTWHFC